MCIRDSPCGGRRGYAVRPRLYLGLLHDRSREDGGTAREALHPDYRQEDFDDEGDIAEHSLSKLIASTNPDLDEEIKTLIFASAKAIQAIPQPFRNNIDSEESVAAMNTCMELANLLLNEVKPYVNQTFGDPEYDDDLDAIAEQFVDAVVLPTYKDLQEKNKLLLDAVNQFRQNPSNDNFEKACNLWITAREPWEKSEAFLFGPVDEMGLDPNMDSWPLDQNAIVQILNSQSWSDLEWSEGDDEAAAVSYTHLTLPTKLEV